MATSFTALLYRPSEIPERALSLGFAVALAGWDLPSPRLLLAPVPGLLGWSAAFYSPGSALGGEDELEHMRELFEEELSPPACVLDAAAEMGHPEAKVYALVYSDELLHDEAMRFDAVGFLRCFVREGDEGLEVGRESNDASQVKVLDFEADEAALAPHRGSTFLSGELEKPVLAALVGALFAADRRLPIQLCDPGPDGIADATIALCRALGRTPGRGASEPVSAGEVRPPASYAAFAASYDWADPADPEDLYRGLSIGAIEGVMRFLRPAEIDARAREPGWAEAARKGLYPVARLLGSALGGGGKEGAFLGLGGDGASLWVIGKDGRPRVAGPHFGELLRYLALGWSRRSDPEEDLIGALMLKARVRREKG